MKAKQQLRVPIWLIIFIVGLPLFSETAYAPALPAIASYFSAAETTTQYTMTIYLLGFAVGVFAWGIISDKCGRKPCLLAGFTIYIIGSMLCYYSSSIEVMIVARFIQGFGASVGSVLSQAVCRDAFTGTKLYQLYSMVGGFITFFTAIGPVVGGYMAQHYDWNYIFLLLVVLGIIMVLSIAFLLPETHLDKGNSRLSVVTVFGRLARDPKVIGCTFLVSICNGIVFSYYSEGPFYFQKLLDMSPISFGSTFLGTAAFSALGNLTSHKMLKNSSPQYIIKRGILIVVFFMSVFAMSAMSGKFSSEVMIYITVMSMMCTFFGIGLIAGNCLSIALTEYKDCTGTASSLFGSAYCNLSSLYTFIIALLHSNSLVMMPLYFSSLAVIMYVIFGKMLRKIGA